MGIETDDDIALKLFRSLHGFISLAQTLDFIDRHLGCQKGEEFWASYNALRGYSLRDPYRAYGLHDPYKLVEKAFIQHIQRLSDAYGKEKISSLCEYLVTAESLGWSVLP